MNQTLCALNSELSEAKKMLADNHPLVSLGAQLSKLKSINQGPTSLDADQFNAIYQSVMPKASPEAIYIGGGLILCGLLDSIGINDNNIISGILNGITSPLSLWPVVKKSHKAKFMRISGFVCKYPCSTSCDKGDRDRLVQMVK